MNRSDFRFLNRSNLTALVLVTGSALGLLAACSSDENTVPTKPPPISTGGGGGTGEGGEAGESTSGGSTNGGSTSQGGSSNGGKGGSAPIEEGGAGDEGGEAGGGPVIPDCPTSDLGFLNAPSPATTQKSKFDGARLPATTQSLP